MHTQVLYTSCWSWSCCRWKGLTWVHHLARDTVNSFSKAQLALKNPKSITIPRPSDHLIITSDGAVGSIGSILFVMQNGSWWIIFSQTQAPSSKMATLWGGSPCQIGSAINHWGPHILETEHQTKVLSDLRPCIKHMGSSHMVNSPLMPGYQLFYPPLVDTTSAFSIYLV